MPFGPAVFPSLGLSLLKALLRQAGFDVRVHYATLQFAERLGQEQYERIALAGPQDLVGDWVFANALHPGRGGADTEYLRTILGDLYDPEFVDLVLNARSLVPAFLSHLVDEVLVERPAVVGFTSTFAQHAASLAAARAIKVRCSETSIIFGGANCEGDMGDELVHRYNFVDAVVSGEAEAVIIDLVQRLVESRPIGGLPGVRTSASAHSEPIRSGQVIDLDALPIPDFDDYFFAIDAADGDCVVPPRCLMVEASRGCWWGAKHHCTFCGLNGSRMAFRSKSPKRFVDELASLSLKYGTSNVSTADNILDYRYYRTVLPEIAARGLNLQLFFEVKANLAAEHLDALRAAGVTRVQPGIESLDTGVLTLMRKGISALQNVQTLKLCKERGIAVVWNLLMGFPSEDPLAYARMTKLFPLLTHLPPPEIAARIRMDRFSPLFNNASEFGLINVRPAPAYELVYGGSVESLRRMAYYFTFGYEDGRDVASYTQEFVEAAQRWNHDHERSDLCMLDGGDSVLIVDRRPSARQPFVVLSGIERAVYLACERVASARAIVEKALEVDRGSTAGEVISACSRLVAEGLMLAEDGRYLSLALPLDCGSASSSLRERVNAFVAS